MSFTHRVLQSDDSLTLFVLLVVVLASVARLWGQTWSFIASMNSCLGFVRSLSHSALSCLLVVVFLLRRHFLRFMLRILAYVLRIYFGVRSMLVLRRSCPHLLVVRVALILIAATTTRMVIPSLIA